MNRNVSQISVLFVSLLCNVCEVILFDSRKNFSHTTNNLLFFFFLLQFDKLISIPHQNFAITFNFHWGGGKNVLKWHTKTVRDKRCKLKVIYISISFYRIATLIPSKFQVFPKFLKKIFFCNLFVFHEFWLKWSYQLQRKIRFCPYSHILTKSDKIKNFFKFKKFGKNLKFSGY